MSGRPASGRDPAPPQKRAWTGFRHRGRTLHNCSVWRWTQSCQWISTSLTLSVAAAITSVHCGTSDLVWWWIAQGFVTARLDYGNGLLLGTTARNLDRLQVAQNALTRAVCQALHSFSATDLRCSLHWLPIRQRIDYRIATITCKVRQTNTPVYMASLISDYIPSRTLRSSDRLLLYQPATILTFSQKVFAFASPTIWNRLPFHCRSATTFNCFKCKLKTFLFAIAYGPV